MNAHAHIPPAAEPSTALTPALRFVHEPMHPNDEGNILLTLRERGFATISNVFERDSVDAYLAQVTAAVRPTDAWWSPSEVPQDTVLTVHPTRAPRLCQMLRRAFNPIAPGPHVGLISSGWIVRPHHPEPKVVHDWHKDGDHLVLACRDGHYDYPSVIHAVMYFTDRRRGPVGSAHLAPRLGAHRAGSAHDGDPLLLSIAGRHRQRADDVAGPTPGAGGVDRSHRPDDVRRHVGHAAPLASWSFRSSPFSS